MVHHGYRLTRSEPEPDDSLETAGHVDDKPLEASLAKPPVLEDFSSDLSSYVYDRLVAPELPGRCVKIACRIVPDHDLSARLHFMGTSEASTTASSATFTMRAVSR